MNKTKKLTAAISAHSVVCRDDRKADTTDKRFTSSSDVGKLHSKLFLKKYPDGIELFAKSYVVGTGSALVGKSMTETRRCYTFFGARAALLFSSQY